MLADGKWGGGVSAIGNIPSAETRPTPKPAMTRPVAGIKEKLAYALKKGKRQREKENSGGEEGNRKTS